MSFVANVLTVLIASPSDVPREREIATQEIHRWNAAHGRRRKLVLSPVRWETHASPQMGEHPQFGLNKQILSYADIVVGIFWTRIGTATPDDISGTAEEINKHVAAGKPAMVYFSNAPLPPGDLDQDQWNALQAFKAECRTKALFHEFDTLERFREAFSHHLNLELNKDTYTSLDAPIDSTSRGPIEPSLSDEERELLAAIREDTYGSVLHGRTHEGFFAQTSNKSFGDNTPRGMVVIQQALKKLRQLGYLTAISDEVDELTGDGFTRADKEASRAVSPSAQPAVTPKAAELLQAAVNNKGNIMHRSTIGDVDRIYAGGNTFPEAKDPRESAEWWEALQELEEKKLIKMRSKALYEVTAAGFRLAESLN